LKLILINFHRFEVKILESDISWEKFCISIVKFVGWIKE